MLGGAGCRVLSVRSCRALDSNWSFVPEDTLFLSQSSRWLPLPSRIDHLMCVHAVAAVSFWSLTVLPRKQSSSTAALDRCLRKVSSNSIAP